MPSHVLARSTGFVAALVACAVLAQSAAPVAPRVDPVALATRVQQDVAELRGLPFKQPVPMQMQSPEGLGEHLDKAMDEAVPPAIATHYGKIVKRLGLHRGPELADFRGLMRTVMTTQAAAYYDADTKRIFLLAEGGNELEQGVIYSHELYHGLQDQYFDLNKYAPQQGKFDADQMLARTAVVEGEATYIHTLWALKRMTGSVPQRMLAGPVIRMQAELSLDQLRAMVAQGGPDKQAEIDAVPPFILDVMVGNYLKGAAFVFAVQEKGWSEVEKLYNEYPPQSTEQILHPEKWAAREAPSKITWPDFARARVLRGWELLDSDVMGEIQWRIVFKVNGQQAVANAAAEGWDGDRYAVFKRKGSDQTLLLWRTAWDSEAEATQFAEAYRLVQAAKYENASEPARVEQQGTEVFIVEGGSAADLDALMAVVKRGKRTRA